MKYWKLYFIFPMMFININIFSQTLAPGFPKLMYVTSKEGLRERTEPSIKGNVIKTFSYGEMVQVFSRQSTPVTIDGITDYWYSTRYSDKSNNWIFGGYLSEELPNDLPIIIGMWDVINNERMAINFFRNYFFRFGLKETSSSVIGTWRINENRITVDLEWYPPPGDEGEVQYETINIQLKVINKNNIELTFSSEIFEFKFVKLKRSRTGW